MQTATLFQASIQYFMFMFMRNNSTFGREINHLKKSAFISLQNENKY